MESLIPTHKVKLSRDLYGYKRGTWVKVVFATNLPYHDNFWIAQGKWKSHAVGARLTPEDITTVSGFLATPLGEE